MRDQPTLNLCVCNATEMLCLRKFCRENVENYNNALWWAGSAHKILQWAGWMIPTSTLFRQFFGLKTRIHQFVGFWVYGSYRRLNKKCRDKTFLSSKCLLLLMIFGDAN